MSPQLCVLTKSVFSPSIRRNYDDSAFCLNANSKVFFFSKVIDKKIRTSP